MIQKGDLPSGQGHEHQGQIGQITQNITQNNNYCLGLINLPDSDRVFNPFDGYHQRLRRQSKSPYSRLAGGF